MFSNVVRSLKAIVRKNSAGSEFVRRRLNLIEGDGVVLTVADDAANDEVDVTVAKATTVVETDQANTWSTGAQDFGSATSLKVPTSGGAAPTGEGLIAYDSTQEKYVAGGGSGSDATGSFPRVLHASRPNDTEAANDGGGTAERDYAQTYTLPANYLIANKAVRVTAGFVLNSSASAPTFRLKLKLGSTILYDSSAVSPGNNASNQGTSLMVLLQGTAAPGASVNVEGSFLSTIASSWPLRPALAQPVAVATNASQDITLSIQFSATTAGNSLRLQSLLIEELN